jgi:site-specific DNA-methyltransferase (adenine-specific)
MTPQRRLTPQPRQHGQYANDAWKAPRILRDVPALDGNPNGRNARTVWRIPSESFSGAHYACFPQALVRRCLLAGISAYGCCAVCGAPLTRTVERSFRPMTDRTAEKLIMGSGAKGLYGDQWSGRPRGYVDTTTTGWSPTCACAAGVQPCTVLDPFAGSGTTLLVARELGHNAIGIDLSYPYLATIARERLGLAKLDAWHGRNGHPAPAVVYDDLPLFGG